MGITDSGTGREIVTVREVPSLVNMIADEPVDLTVYGDKERKRIGQIVAETPRLEGRAVTAFASEPQEKANSYLDELLAGIRTGDVGESGEIVALLAGGIKMLNIPAMREEAEGKVPAKKLVKKLAKIPVVGGFFNRHLSAFQKFRENHADIIEHFRKIEDQGRRDMAALAAVDNSLERQVEKNVESVRELGLWEVAGRVILRREKELFKAEREAALANMEPVQLARLRDHDEQISAFETRLMRLAMAVEDAMTNVPETRLMQSAGRIEYQNILDTIQFDLPRLKRAILRVANLKKINDASASTDSRRALANQTAAAGIEMLETAYTKAKESQSGALAEIAAMGQIADSIVGIIDKGARIDTANRESREEAMRRLEAVKRKFVASLIDSTANTAANTPLIEN